MAPIPATIPLALLLAEGASNASRLGGSQGPDLTRYFFVCGGLLIATAVLAWGFRRLIGRAVRSRAAQRSLQVIDVLPLGGKQKLTVVRCYDRTFLLGVGDKELCSIAELDAVIAPKRETQPTKADLQTFAGVFERLGVARKPAQPAAREEIFG